MPDEIKPNAAYSVAQVAGLLAIDMHAVYRAIEEGSLRSFLPNGNVRGLRVLGRWVIEWMEGGHEEAL